MLKLESARNGKSWDDIENDGSEQVCKTKSLIKHSFVCT